MSAEDIGGEELGGWEGGRTHPALRVCVLRLILCLAPFDGGGDTRGSGVGALLGCCLLFGRFGESWFGRGHAGLAELVECQQRSWRVRTFGWQNRNDGSILHLVDIAGDRVLHSHHSRQYVSMGVLAAPAELNSSAEMHLTEPSESSLRNSRGVPRTMRETLHASRSSLITRD